MGWGRRVRPPSGPAIRRRRVRLANFGALLALLVLEVACGDHPETTTPSVLPNVGALENHAVWIDTANDEALYLEVTAASPSPEVRRVAVAENPTLLQHRNGHDEVLLLALGEEDEGNSILSVLDAGGVDRRYELGTRFDALTQSDDGRFAFVRVVGETGDILFNPNEVALVDLDDRGDDAVVQRTLRSIGTGPQAVVFSPTMDVAGEARRLAVVLSSSQVALLDLNHPRRPEYTIELTSNTNVGLNQVRFSPEEQKIYLLGSNSSDIYVLTLLPAGPNRENDFEPSLNTLGAGDRPTDMALYGEGDDARLLAVAGTRALVIEAGSNRITSIDLGVAGNSLHLFEGTAPFDDEVETRALIYGQNSSSVAFLDLVQVEERTTRNVETVRLGGSISTLHVLEDDLILVLHQNQSLSLLNLVDRTVAPITARVDVGSTLTNPDLNRLWVGSPGSTVLGYLDLENFHPGQVDLGLPISEVLLFTSGRRKRVLVDHSGPVGRATVLDAKRPEDRSRATTLNGFFLQGALN